MSDIPPVSNVPPAPPPMNYETAGGPIEQNAEARLWGMLSHLTALSGFIIPFGSIIGPLVCWLVKKDQHPFVDDQGKESLNFNITMAIISIVCAILVFVFIGLLLLPVVLIAWLVFTVIATIKANNGERYRYPFALRLIK